MDNSCFCYRAFTRFKRDETCTTPLAQAVVMTDGHAVNGVQFQDPYAPQGLLAVKLSIFVRYLPLDGFAHIFVGPFAFDKMLYIRFLLKTINRSIASYRQAHWSPRNSGSACRCSTRRWPSLRYKISLVGPCGPSHTNLPK
jgi:hypothetical protein